MQWCTHPWRLSKKCKKGWVGERERVGVSDGRVAPSPSVNFLGADGGPTKTLTAGWWTGAREKGQPTPNASQYAKAASALVRRCLLRWLHLRLNHARSFAAPLPAHSLAGEEAALRAERKTQTTAQFCARVRVQRSRAFVGCVRLAAAAVPSIRVCPGGPCPPENARVTPATGTLLSAAARF